MKHSQAPSVYQRYPVSGILQSYRYTRRSRTIVMPILILSLLGGLLCFYIASDPERIARKASEKAESIPSHQAHGSEDAIEVLGEKDPHPAESPVANPETTSASIIPLANPEQGARARG